MILRMIDGDTDENVQHAWSLGLEKCIDKVHL